MEKEEEGKIWIRMYGWSVLVIILNFGFIKLLLILKVAEFVLKFKIELFKPCNLGNNFGN